MVLAAAGQLQTVLCAGTPSRPENSPHISGLYTLSRLQCGSAQFKRQGRISFAAQPFLGNVLSQPFPATLIDNILSTVELALRGSRTKERLNPFLRPEIWPHRRTRFPKTNQEMRIVRAIRDLNH